MFVNRQVVKREGADRGTDKQPQPVQRPSNSNTHAALVTQMDKHKGDRRLVRRDSCIHLFPVSPRSPCADSWRVFKTYTLKQKSVIPSARLIRLALTRLQFTHGLRQQLSVARSLSRPGF